MVRGEAADVYDRAGAALLEIAHKCNAANGAVGVMMLVTARHCASVVLERRSAQRAAVDEDVDAAEACAAAANIFLARSTSAMIGKDVVRLRPRADLAGDRLGFRVKRRDDDCSAGGDERDAGHDIMPRRWHDATAPASSWSHASSTDVKRRGVNGTDRHGRSPAMTKIDLASQSVRQ